MKKGVFIVGGFARDRLLGRIPKDLDFVVVGYTLQEFLETYPEMKPKSVGQRFPVFLDAAGNQYAFARSSTAGSSTESIDPSISLQEDLAHRDMTINTFAICPEHGDVFGSSQAFQDLEKKKIRHLPGAFEEDPIRILRIAKFAARYPEFSIARETIRAARLAAPLLRDVHQYPVWLEIQALLSENTPGTGFAFLQKCGALVSVLPELDALVGVPAGPKAYHPEKDAFRHSLRVLSSVCEQSQSLTTRFAALVHDLGKGVTDRSKWPTHHFHDADGLQLFQTLCTRLMIPTTYRKAGELAIREHMRARVAPEMALGKKLTLAQKLTKFPGGMLEFLVLLQADSVELEPAVPKVLQELSRFIQEVQSTIRLPEHLQNLGEESGKYLQQFRIQALRKFLKETDSHRRAPSRKR